MKNSKLLNSLIFQLLTTIIFSVRLLATEPVDIWEGSSAIKTKSSETSQIDLDNKKKSLSNQDDENREIHKYMNKIINEKINDANKIINEIRKDPEYMEKIVRKKKRTNKKRNKKKRTNKKRTKRRK